MRETRKQIAALVLVLAAGLPLLAQQAQPVQGDNSQQQGGANPASQNNPQINPQPAQQLPPDTIRPNYVLGPNGSRGN
jgi:hypothetical protein